MVKISANAHRVFRKIILPDHVPSFFSFLDKNNQRRELPWHKILEFVNIVSLLYEIIPKVPVTQLVFKGERFFCCGCSVLTLVVGLKSMEGGSILTFLFSCL